VSRRDCAPSRDTELEWIGLLLGMGHEAVESFGASVGEETKVSNNMVGACYRPSDQNRRQQRPQKPPDRGNLTMTGPG